MNTTKVFISHSSHDRETVEREIVQLLRRYDIDTWYSTADIATAQEWEKSIRQALTECDWFLVALSPRSIESAWVRSEVHWAAEHRWGRIVPVMLETCDPLDLHLRLPQIQYVDFRTDMEAAGHRLLAVWGIRSRREELAYEYSEHKTYQEVRDHVARLSGYSLLRTLGQGEISHAFLARSETLGVPVVIKVVTANLGEPWRTMVRETAEKLLDVRHPAVVTTYAVIEKGKFLSIVTEYVDGFTLDKVMSSIGTPAQACNMMADVAEALDFVHRRGILHNHLKPSNILVDREGRPHVLDFGPHPPSGVILGSPTYVPPERIRGNRSDPRSDIWVCGVLLYEMLTGQRPFDTGESDFETRQPMAESKPRPLRDWNPSIPRDIEKICLRCLACDPQQRYPSAGDLAAALRGGAQMCDRPSG